MMLKQRIASTVLAGAVAASCLPLAGCDTPVGQGAGIGAGAGAIIGGLATNRVGGAALGAARYGPPPPQGRYPFATPTDRPGFVLSPYSPYYQIDVRDIPHGSLVRDPSCNRLFVKP